jgi:hypothetical protein
MSSYSHKKSIIPIKDVLIPIQDGDVLFPFDHHLASTQLHYPEGWDNHTVTDYGLYTGTNLCATLRKGEGRFGGAVAVEEGTENLVPSNRLKFEGWLAYGGAQVTRTQNVEFPEIGRNNATRIRTTGGTSTLKYYLPIETSIADQAYTGSVYIKNIGSKPIRFYTQFGSIVTVNPGEWTRAVASGVGNGTSQFQLRFQALNADDDLDFIAWGPQAERKPFTTSFVDGTRPDGILAYPITLKDDYTIACYRKSHTDDDYKHIVKRSDGTVYVDGVKDSEYDVGWIAGRNLLLDSRELKNTGGLASGISRRINEEGHLEITAAPGNGNWASGLGIVLNPDHGLQNGDIITVSVKVKSEDATGIPTLYLGNGMGYLRFNGEIGPEFSTIQYTRVWNGPHWSPHMGFSGISGTFVFKEVKLEKGSTTTNWTPAPEDLGYSSDLFMLSNQTGVIDDLMISKRVLSPEEIMAIYHSQRPLYDPNRIDHIVG